MRIPSKAVFLALLLLPRVAEACPMCVGQKSGGTARAIALGVMMLLPFSIAVVVFAALRRAGRAAAAKDSKSRAATP